MNPAAPFRHILILGAGIFGVTAALELRRRGHAVTLCDPGPIPHPMAASTDLSKVIRMDYGADELYTGLMEIALAGWELWNHQWKTPLYHQDGFLLLTPEAMQPGSFEQDSFQFLQQRGHKLQRLTPDILKTNYPLWNSGPYRDGYFNPHAGWAESGAVVARLLREVRACGVAVQENTACRHLLESGSRVTGFVDTAGAEHTADLVLLAAGAWTPTLLPELSSCLWATGQPVLHFQPKNPAAFEAPQFPVWAADIARTGWYGFPALADGTLKIANHGPGRRVHPDDPREVTAEEEAKFRAFLRATLPALADAPIIGRRLCLYCDSFDGDFWIDHHPQRPGLAVAAGDSGHAFKFAPVLGGLIADIAEEKPNPYTTRFAWRAAPNKKKESARSSAS